VIVATEAVTAGEGAEAAAAVVVVVEIEA
jgi:hypothetical protein